MKTVLRSARLVAPFALTSLALAGCISLFPKTKPALLYRFGAPAPASAPAAPAAGGFAVRLSPIGFPVSTAADRILTVDGERVAYVAGGRWVTAAATLFESAVVQTFDTHGGPARLLARGEIAPAALVLKLDVRRFEARYDQGAATAPTVMVEVYAALDNPADATQHRQRIFVERVPASENRMEPIVVAYDQAVGKVCGEVVDWVNARGG
jgi:cholesterol transport system auxiliary component